MKQKHSSHCSSGMASRSREAGRAHRGRTAIRNPSTTNSKWISAIPIGSDPWVSLWRRSTGPHGNTTIRGFTQPSRCRHQYLRRRLRRERIKKRQENLSSDCLKKGVHFSYLRLVDKFDEGLIRMMAGLDKTYSRFARKKK